MTDREAIQALVTELYSLVSGPGDRSRDWGREAELFMPQAHMIRTVIDGRGHPRPEVIRAADYPANFERKMGGRDFYEVEVDRSIETFGTIAHVFSTYEAYEDSERRRLIKRGINSIQLYKVDGEWKIANMVWDDEREGLTVAGRNAPNERSS